MPEFISEEQFENIIQNEFNFLGWEVLYSPKFRPTYRQVLNEEVLKNQIRIINNLNDELKIKEIIKKIDSLIWTHSSFQDQNNVALDILRNGIKLKDEKQQRTISYSIIDFNNYKNNRFQFVRQFNVWNSNGDERIPDFVLFVNGLPLVVGELKSPLAYENVKSAYEQMKTLYNSHNHLFTFNIFSFLSNQNITKYGCLSNSFKYFAGWQKWYLDKNDKSKTPISFLFEKKTFLDIIKNFIFWAEKDDKKYLQKYVAFPHQIEATNLQMRKLLAPLNEKNKGGIIWHTQGSGKSLTMLFLTNKIKTEIENSTVILITDRNDLEDQLFNTFNKAKKSLLNNQNIIKINSRKEFKEQLDQIKAHRIFFSSIQKLEEDTGLCSTRENIYIICDEAHRSQNNTEGKIKINNESKQVEEKYGFAYYLRKAFPNAVYMGFTGTPLMGVMKIHSKEIFGDYTHTYTLDVAQENGSVVPIYYENPNTQINYPDELKEQIRHLDQKLQDAIATDLEEIKYKKQKDAEKIISYNTILENKTLIEFKAKHILDHYTKRQKVLNGKAMIVASSRKAAWFYYIYISNNAPYLKDKVKLIVTTSNKDDEEISKDIPPKLKQDEIINKFKDVESEIKILIVCDKLLTGYDCPDLDVMYLDKILKWHTLMQAIARVNRIYEGNGKIKEHGVIVDYNNIYGFLIKALAQYTGSDKQNIENEFTLQDIEIAIKKANDKLNIINEIYLSGIKNIDLNDKEYIYKFIIQNSENIHEKFDNQNKQAFLTHSKDLKRYVKIANNHINKDLKQRQAIVSLIRQLIIQKSIEYDEKISLIKEDIIRVINEVFENNGEEIISISNKTFKKNIKDLTDVLKNADELKILSPRASFDFMREFLKKEISELKSTRPYAAQKLVDKLQKIIDQFNLNQNIEILEEKIREICKEMFDTKNMPREFDDPQLQTFFEIISDDHYFSQTYHNNSAVLRKIVEEINNKIMKNLEGKYVDFIHNPKINRTIVYELKVLLKNKFNYPPEKLRESKIDEKLTNNLVRFIPRKTPID